MYTHAMFAIKQQVNSSGLVYDGRLVVDLNFRTADAVSTDTYYYCYSVTNDTYADQFPS
jgi:hypothetical protein